jgi:hypothetical protein
MKCFGSTILRIGPQSITWHILDGKNRMFNVDKNGIMKQGIIKDTIYSSTHDGERYWVITDGGLHWASEEKTWPLEAYMKITQWKHMFARHYET